MHRIVCTVSFSEIQSIDILVPRIWYHVPHPSNNRKIIKTGSFRRQNRSFLDGARLQDLALRHIIIRTSYTEAHRVSRVSHSLSWDHSFSGQNFVEVIWNLAVQLSSCTYCRSTLARQTKILKRAGLEVGPFWPHFYINGGYP